MGGRQALRPPVAMDFQTAIPSPSLSQLRLSQVNLMDESIHVMKTYFERSTFITDQTVMGA